MDATITFNLIQSNGVDDTEASRQNLLAQFDAFMSDRATFLERIAQAVNGVFDRSDTPRINLPHIVSMAIADLKVSPKDYGKWEGRVLEYVRCNSTGPDSIFEIGKGSKNGGVARRVRAAVVVEAVSRNNSEPATRDQAAE